MATLTAPHRAIGYKKGRNPSTRKMPAKGKYHFMKRDGDPTGDGLTVCGLIVWGPDLFDGKPPCYPGTREQAYDIVEISSIPAERICKKCLGPLHAED